MKKYYCKYCKEELPYDSGRQGTKRCRKCYMKTLVGEGNPMFGKKRPEMLGKNNPMYKEKIKVNCSYCNRVIEINPYKIKITKNFFCNEEHFYLWKKENILKENNPNWIDGRSFLPYSFEFTVELKEQIRERDNYKCQNCGMIEEEHLAVFGQVLHVHHIDYNKQNCNKNNLITLCRQCNIRVNSNRDYWVNIYTTKIGVIYGSIQN